MKSRSKIYKIIIYLVIFCLISGSVFGVFWLIKKSLFPEVGVSHFDLSQPSQYNQSLIISSSRFKLIITPVNAQSVNLLKEADNRIKYIEAFPNTDVVQVKYPYKLKESLILKKPGHPEEFAYRINLEEFDYERDEQGNLHFYLKNKKDELHKLFTIPAPFMIDADDRKSSPNEIEMKIENNLLILKPSQAWLAQAKYPVILDPTIEIHILNVQSYPEVDGEWEVGFTTLGKADLIIEGLNNTDFGQEIEFKSLKCGQEDRLPKRIGNSYIYKNWSCNQEASFISKVLQSGKHHLHFSFGGKQADAYNDASNSFSGDPNCSALWKLESGALVTDSIGGNTLTNTGVAEDTSNQKEGTGCGDWELTQSDYMERTDANLDAGFPLKNGDTNKKISVCFWTRPEQDNNIANYIFSKYSTGDDKRSFAITIDSGFDDKFTILQGHTGGTTFQALQHGTSITYGRWYHVCATYDDSDRSYYIRVWDDTAGAILGSDASWFANNAINVEDAPLRIGSRADGEREHDGLIDEMVVFNDILTVTEMDQIRTGTYVRPVTEFKVSIKPSGGDYTSLSAAENALDYTGSCDLTSDNYKTCAYDGAVGDPTAITDTEAVTWDSEASSGNIIHVTTNSKSGKDAFFIYTTDPLTDNDVIDDGNGNTITVNGTPDTAQITFECYAMQDATKVSISGWTTDSTHYIRIYTPTSERHDGTWDTNAYRLVFTATGNYQVVLWIGEAYVRVEGLQVEFSDGGYKNIIGIRGRPDSAASDVRVSHCIVRGGTFSNSEAHHNGIDAYGNGIYKIWNNIVYDVNYNSKGHGFINFADSGSTYFYNNTAVDCYEGFNAAYQSTLTAINNLGHSNDNKDFAQWYSGISSSYNASSDNTADDAGGTGNRINQTFTFEGASDFHLAVNDQGARGYGLSQHDDSNCPVTDDIDGEDRRNNGEITDIGADEDIDTLWSTSVRRSTIKSSGGSFTSLFDWEGREDGDITNYYPVIAECYASASPDTTAVDIDDWITDATHYIKVYTPTAERHDGKWNTNKYRLESNSPAYLLSIYENNVRLEGLQLKVTASSGDNRMIYVLNQDASADIRISHCITTAALSGTAGGSGVSVNDADVTVKIWNNIIYDIIRGTSGTGINLGTADPTAYVYNNTVYNCYIGIHVSSDSPVTLKNNIANACNDGFSYGGGSITSDYNASDIDGDASGANSRNGTDGDVTFANEGADDFHLGSSDTNAKDHGVSDPGSGLFSDDIDGDSRPIGSDWDIGADEGAAGVPPTPAAGTSETKTRIRGGVKIRGGTRFK